LILEGLAFLIHVVVMIVVPTIDRPVHMIEDFIGDLLANA